MTMQKCLENGMFQAANVERPVKKCPENEAFCAAMRPRHDEKCLKISMFQLEIGEM